MNSTASGVIQTEIPNSLRGILALFESLPSSAEIPTTGRFIGQAIGPKWLTLMGAPMMHIGALAGWKGKQFYANNHVMNVVVRRGQEQEVVPINASIAPYSKGAGNTLELAYPSSSPFPWNHVVDELRQLPDGRYLGITTLGLPLLNLLPYPFTLTPC